LGGSNAHESQKQGWLELHLANARPNQLIKFRNMAWPADTVDRQDRPRNYFSQEKPDYGEADQRQRIKVDTTLLWFGKIEALQGEAGRALFERDYSKMIAQAKKILPKSSSSAQVRMKTLWDLALI
jgi:hypothetical protein